MVLDRIREHLPRLSEAKQRIALHILQNWQEVAFLSVGQLARAVGVSESVVVRTATDLGYSGYPDLQDEVRYLVKQRLSLVDMYRRSAQAIEKGETRRLIDQVVSADLENITYMSDHLPVAEAERAVEMLLSANRIVLLAARSSAGPAQVMALYLNAILGNAQFCTNTFGELYDPLRNLTPNDLAVAISFAWYSQQTVSALEYCRERGARTISITDNHSSPLALLSDVTLIARPDGVSYYLSQTATMSLVNILLYLVANRASDRSIRALQEMEQLYSRFYSPKTSRRATNDKER